MPVSLHTITISNELCPITHTHLYLYMCVYVHTHICTRTSGCFSSEHAPQSQLPRLFFQTGSPSNCARLAGPQLQPPKNEPFPRTLPLPSAWARLSRSMFSAGARTKVTVTCSPGSGRGPSQKLLKSSWNKPNFPHWLCPLSNSTGRSLSKGSSPHPVPHPTPCRKTPLLQHSERNCLRKMLVS